MDQMCSEYQLEKVFALVSLAEQPSAPGNDGRAGSANVPFDFVVGEMLLPAGTYDLNETEIPGLLALRQNGCDYPAALVQEIRSERNSSKLLFYRQENLYFLAQVLAGRN
jgi:hypothetical protein